MKILTRAADWLVTYRDRLGLAAGRRLPIRVLTMVDVEQLRVVTAGLRHSSKSCVAVTPLTITITETITIMLYDQNCAQASVSATSDPKSSSSWHHRHGHCPYYFVIYFSS